MTKNARLILNMINTSHDHLTAEQIYLRLKEINAGVVLATVYNNLSVLYRQGLIRKVSTEGRPDRYDKIARHDHLVCWNCGRLSDVTLPDLTEQLCRETGIRILSYDLKMNYVCPSCLEKEKTAGRNNE